MPPKRKASQSPQKKSDGEDDAIKTYEENPKRSSSKDEPQNPRKKMKNKHADNKEIELKNDAPNDPPKLSPNESQVFEAEAKNSSERNPAQAKKGKKKQAEIIVTERDVIDRKPLSSEGRYFKIMSWNVNGLRAVHRQFLDKFDQVVKEEAPDLLLLQETKLQESHVSEFEDLLPGYDQHWTCSTAKKGYSGCVAFTRRVAGNSEEPAKKKKTQRSISSFFGKKNPTKVAPAPSTCQGREDGLRVLNVTMGVPDSGCNNEGRSITLEYDEFYVVGLYVPNSGQGLVRLQYRTETWDPALRGYIAELEKKKPVIVTGDLNVAHLDLDIYNAHAKHIKKQAGCTDEERSSFSAFLEGPRKDAFRHFHPDARGNYTYWSIRSDARPVNKGLRLDYFVVTDPLFERTNLPTVHDVFHVYSRQTVGVSDHCPVAIVLQI